MYCDMPHNFGPDSLMSLKPNGSLEPYQAGPMVLRRQDKPVLYARNGPTVLLVKTTTLLADNTLYGSNIHPYLMGELDSFDVDSENDLIIIEALLKQRHT